MAQGAVTVNRNPMDSIRALPTYRPAHDSTTLLTDERIARLDPKRRQAWAEYRARSAQRMLADTSAMRRELRAAGRETMLRGPYATDFVITPEMTPAWFASDSARRIGEIILSFQAPNGGWSKHVDVRQHLREPGESYFTETDSWDWISTIDNGATTIELRFVAALESANHDLRYVAAFNRGVRYLLAMQYPNGCYPQVYPLEGSYHDGASFNDDATVNALTLLRDVSRGELIAVSPDDRRLATKAFDAGVECILRAQYADHGQLVGWPQQADPLTLAPASARSYELTSLSALESSSIVNLLMQIERPSPRVVRAVHAAAAWLRRIPISGYRYAAYQLTADPAAPPLWGRLYELGTGRIIMANRDGITLYDWNKLTDRRTGYGWYTARPGDVLVRFDEWARHHPRSQ